VEKYHFLIKIILENRQQLRGKRGYFPPAHCWKHPQSFKNKNLSLKLLTIWIEILNYLEKIKENVKPNDRQFQKRFFHF
jgi:hypothetical protein